MCTGFDKSVDEDHRGAATFGSGLVYWLDDLREGATSMSIKTILAVLGAKHAAADASQAVELARESGSHLSILVLGAALSPVTADYPLTTAWLEERQKEVDELISARVEAEALCQKNGVSYDADQIYDDRFILENNLCTRSLYADIVLAGNGIRKDGDLRKTVIAATVFDARSPLVFLAPELKTTLRPKKVLLAWNSRPEAARAAKEALPLLVQADAVHIVLVDPDASYYSNGGEPGADVAAFLSRHGVKAVVEQLASAERRVEGVLQQRAREIGCDMIVMGAYGHSRLRERIFGGVTASILEECQIPVFLAR
ncbi:universal stress protein [Rhizobium sp. ZX09]|uniref:universal stress protein n=1 Tax=Rhizobium sp. ZX09 TaxID=2291939 RepID=UPI001FEDF451|nr:universal stress protein [Rhizobium sp. ZX09]